MSRFPYSRVLLRLGNTLGSWPQVGLPRQNPLDRNWVALPHGNPLVQEPPLLDICNPLDRNWVALPHENPLVQEPPLLDICNPVNFRQSCAKWNAKIGNRYLTFVAFEISPWIQSHTNPKIGGFFKVPCCATLERSPSRLCSIYGTTKINKINTFELRSLQTFKKKLGGSLHMSSGFCMGVFQVIWLFWYPHPMANKYWENFTIY